eukprot:729582-Pelagomonas_calceolata.AAC.1
MLVCCSARNVEEWAGLHIPTGELCTGGGALVQRQAQAGATPCTATMRAAMHAVITARSNACSNARSNAALIVALTMASRMQSMYIMACSSAVKGVNGVPCLKPVSAGFANCTASLATLPPLVPTSFAPWNRS